MHRGPLTVVSLLLVLALSAATFALHMSDGRQEELRARSRYELVAGCVGEAGIGAAIFDLKLGGTGNLGSAERPVRLGEGSYWVHTTRLENGCYSLSATGCAGESQSVTVLVARPRKNTATLALDTMSLRTTAIPTLQP